MVILLVACVATPHRPDPDPVLDTGVDSATDTATPDLEGITVELATVPTVVRVYGESDSPVLLSVTGRFGDGEEVRVTETAASTTHTLLLTGLPPDTEVELAIASDDGAGRVRLHESTLTTGSLPAWVPVFTYAADAPELAEGGFVVAPILQDMTGGVVVVDGKGRVVWSWPQDDDGLGFLPMRARLSLDGTAILYNNTATDIAHAGELYRVSLDGDDVARLEFTGGHTDFVEYTPGGYLMLGWDLRIFEGRQILGDTILELSPDKALRQVWSAYDSFEPDLSHTWPSFYPADLSVEDWTHINGITYDAAEDQVLVTTTFNYAVVAVDRTAGALDWYLTDFQGGDFTNVEGEVFMSNPHSVQRLDEGLLVFSRGEPTWPDSCSEVVELGLDMENLEAWRAWSYTDAECILVSFLGDAWRLDGGNTLVTWTTAGRIDEVTPDGALAWQVSVPVGKKATGNVFGFTDPVARLGP